MAALELDGANELGEPYEAWKMRQDELARYPKERLHLVLVVGAKGCGKTRLLNGVARQAAAVGNPRKFGVVLRGVKPDD